MAVAEFMGEVYHVVGNLASNGWGRNLQKAMVSGYVKGDRQTESTAPDRYMLVVWLLRRLDQCPGWWNTAGFLIG